MPSTPVTVAFLCFETTVHVRENLNRMAKLAAQAKDQGAQWVFLPEMWTHQSKDLSRFQAMSEQASQEALPFVQALAKRLNLVFFAGSWTEDAQHPSKYYNTQYVIDQQGQVIAQYRKIYLFKVDDGSSNPYRETKKFIPGTQAVTCQVDQWRVGLSTCFDVRFPSHYENMAADGPLDIITVPSAFLRKTGKDHWKVLLKARAIEQQAFVIAANRIGQPEDPRVEFFGHSMVVDPWGDVLLDSKQGEGVFCTEINPTRLTEVRRFLPVTKVKQYKSTSAGSNHE
jgi:predicted amidohydrolase